MKFKESESIEFKKIVTDDLKKEITAFANSNGGTIYIGIEDDGKISGLLNPEKTMLQVNNMIRDNIKPDLTMFVQCVEEIIDGKNLVLVKVQRGTDRPYYVAKKGLRPEGVYVRQGTASVPATETAIRRMIKDTDGESYEDLRSINQSLTFKFTAHEFEKRGIDFADSNMMTLKLINNEGIYTNLGLLLSDQCNHSIKIAIFQDDSMKIFKDRREFTGSLFKQLEEAYDYIDNNNPIRSTFNKLLRIDIRNFPEVAVREALLNAIVHREYALSASTLIKIFPDKIEFISVGSLLKGIELEDILSGFSICRNPNLASIFYRLQLIEAYGTGMQKIFEAYVGSEIEPKIETTPNVFKITLPNINLISKNINASEKFTGSEEKILEFIKHKGSITRKDAEKFLEISQTPAGNLLKELAIKGNIKREGKGKNIRYYLI